MIRGSSLLRWPGVLPVAAALILSLSATSAQILRSRMAGLGQEGNESYAAGRYQEALQAYRDVLVEEPDRLDLHFNIGDALYELGEYAESLAAFRRVDESEDEDLVTGSMYNAGNALFQRGQFAEAARAYTQALRRDPTADDARANLELALLHLRRQHQEQQDASGEGAKQEEGEGASAPGDGEGDGTAREEATSESSDAGSEYDERSAPQASGEDAAGVPERMSRDEALQLLEALEDRDGEAQRLRFAGAEHQSSAAEDW